MSGRWGGRASDNAGARDVKRNDISLKEWEEASKEQKDRWRDEGSTISIQAASELTRRQKKQGTWRPRTSAF